MKVFSSLKLLFVFLFFSVSPSFPQSMQSYITVPIEADLIGLAAYVEAQLPQNPLYRNEYGRTCVEPEKACTKVPEFRGLKVTMRNRCIEVTPRIDCTITEQIDRQGALEIYGNGPSITVRQDIFGSGTVRGRGEIGKHIRQTVRAAAEFTITATPILNDDWTLDANVTIDKRWLQRPEFRLFNAFPVTIGSQIDPPLDAALRKFEAELPAHLASLKMKERANDLWLSLQTPQPLEISDDHNLYLHLRPNAVEFDGFEINGRELSTGLSVALRATVDSDAEGPPQTQLPNLTNISSEGVELVVPVYLDFSKLEAIISLYLPYTFDLLGSSVTIQSARLASEEDSIVITVDTFIEGGSLELLSGQLEMRGRPALSVDRQTVSIEDIRVQAVDDTLLSSFAKNGALRIANLFLDDSVKVIIRDHIEAVSRKLSAALNRQLTPELRLAGAGEISLADLKVSDRNKSLMVMLRVDGQVRIDGFKPFR